MQVAMNQGLITHTTPTQEDTLPPQNSVTINSHEVMFTPFLFEGKVCNCCKTR